MSHIHDELAHLAQENYNFSDRKGNEQFRKDQQELFLKLKQKKGNTNSKYLYNRFLTFFREKRLPRRAN